MNSTKNDFNKRKEEINIYFSFLRVLNSGRISLKYERPDGEEETFPVSTKLQKILIANTFLLLYNLIESTVRNSIVEIYTKITDDQISYQNLSQEMKEVWLEKIGKTLTENKQSDKKVEEKLDNIVSDIINEKIITLTEKDIRVSGNIDANAIRKLAEKNGFEKVKNGRYLEDIKNKRNYLAHGNQTFNDIGKDFTYKDLYEQKEDVFNYLEKVIQNIEDFIKNQKYKNKEV